MAARDKPPIIGTAVMGWRDGLGAINAMPAVAGLTLLILLVISALSAQLMPGPAPVGLEVLLIVEGIIAGIIQAFAVAPLAIAVHRYVLLGEVTPRYALDPSSSRYLRFVGFAILANFLMAAPGLIMALTTATAGESTAVTAMAGVLTTVFTIIAVIVILRRAILFPAIAVDAPGASWSNARNDTMGNSWRVAFILLCVMLPVIALSLLPYFLLMWPPREATAGGRIAFAIVSALLQIVSICTLAAVASHLFRALADRLAVPPGAASA